MKVKVCGITTWEDAKEAVDQGVDALGFNFYRPSPRYIDPGTAREITSKLPPFVAAVGVFVNVFDPEEVCRTAQAAGVQVLQLHGDETPEYCRRLFQWQLIKAIRVGPDSVAADVDDYPVSALLLDARDERLFGGTGRTFDWALAGSIRSRYPIILAGGLNPDNVARAIRAVRPFAVDVCSGIERSPGKKDPARLREFMNEVSDAIKVRQ